MSREAIGMLPDLRAAVKHLSQLKAVGPATASGEGSTLESRAGVYRKFMVCAVWPFSVA